MTMANAVGIQCMLCVVISRHPSMVTVVDIPIVTVWPL